MTEQNDAYSRLVKLFDQDDTASRYVSEDGDGGFVGAVYRMARHIEALSTPSPATAGVTVRALEWVECDFNTLRSETIIGDYLIDLDEATWRLTNERAVYSFDTHPDEAKNAAQSHYEAAILSAITPGTKDDRCDRSAISEQPDRERIAVLEAVDALSDEHLRLIAESTDTGTCRARIRAALITPDMGKEEGK